jgi:RNA polymerase sigma-70 factor (ECF subfamily)
LCLRYAANTEDANDLFQEGFIKLYRNLGNYRFEGSFEGWARTIFVTTCLDALKKKKVQFAEVNEDLVFESKGINANDKLDHDDLMKIVRELPDGYRTIVNLYIIEDYSHKEIAEMLGITESGSKSKLHKARNLLKQKITANNI